MNYSTKGQKRCYKYRVLVETFNYIYHSHYAGDILKTDVTYEFDPNDYEYYLLSWK